MSYLLDTNIISELRKPQLRANAGVRSWGSGRTADGLYLSAITILEDVKYFEPLEVSILNPWS